jgi:hypothetical protein
MSATSSELPTNPTIGDTCYVTDTGQLVVWYGETTGWKPPWSLPWGLVLSTSSSTNATFTTTGSTLSALSGTYSYLAGRSYQLNVVGRLSSGTAGTNSTLSIRIGGTAIQQFTLDNRQVNVQLGFTIAALHQPSTSGSASVDVFGQSSAGTSTAQFSVVPGRLWVTDVGPLSSIPPTV